MKIPAKNPDGSNEPFYVEWPLDKSMFSFVCNKCKMIVGGGFILDDMSLRDAENDAEQYVCCPQCDERDISVVVDDD
jgi:hypothetical protein